MDNPTPSAPKGRKLKVLVAEDNAINQRLAIGMLTSLGHTGVVVGDGEKALKCLERLQFDVVLMDVMMPVMDGLAALAEIRAQEAQRGGHMPVIMATSHAEPGDAQRFRNAGADGYLAKPLNVAALDAELVRLTR